MSAGSRAGDNPRATHLLGWLGQTVHAENETLVQEAKERLCIVHSNENRLRIFRKADVV